MHDLSTKSLMMTMGQNTYSYPLNDLVLVDDYCYEFKAALLNLAFTVLFFVVFSFF